MRACMHAPQILLVLYTILHSVTLPILLHIYAQILRQHWRQSRIMSKPTEFNFKSSQIVGKVQRVTGKKWKASLEGSAQVSALPLIL